MSEFLEQKTETDVNFHENLVDIPAHIDAYLGRVGCIYTEYFPKNVEKHLESASNIMEKISTFLEVPYENRFRNTAYWTFDDNPKYVKDIIASFAKSSKLEYEDKVQYIANCKDLLKKKSIVQTNIEAKFLVNKILKNLKEECPVDEITKIKQDVLPPLRKNIINYVTTTVSKKS